ncbi:MAG: HAD-IC family P-type ATPase, partial [Firmicutes bacterium]|nr:HAD-IC family P-type ATPase [Bacillota bacterium]
MWDFVICNSIILKIVRIYLYGMDNAGKTNYSSMPLPDLAKLLDSNLTQGLSKEEAAVRLAVQGPNKLIGAKKRPLILRFLDQFKNFMVIILLIAAVVSFALSIFEGRSYFDAVIILAVVTLNAVLGLVQESRAQKAIDALKKMTSPTATVIRGGERITISGEEVVTGDLIILETGDFVPCDARLIECHSLQTEESAVTGESIPVHKDKGNNSIVLGTTLVTYGRGTAIAIKTGMNIEVGKIAGLINSHKETPTPLQNKLAQLGKLLGIASLIICGVIFAIGLFTRLPPFEMFMTSISLAVAAIPEGLPAIVTIMLALGVLRMSRHKAIVRKIPAVETLGRATVICSDKTGTLTQNKMTVTDCNPFEVSKQALLDMATLCCDVGNDPTETAIINASEAHGKTKASLDTAFPRLYEMPFDSVRKLMTTVNMYEGRRRVITKGAPDMLLKKCTGLSAHARQHIDKTLSQMAANALRVIAVAYKDINEDGKEIKDKDLENNLIFAGLIGMIDPPRPEVAGAIKLCRKAGIKPVMITGDHIGTAVAIASQIGILKNGEAAITGEELDRMNERDLIKNIYKYSVFARVSPTNKMQIVRAFQARGAIVAMTGDGVNDAPALKSADIGCAMGITGTDVAKGASDMVLTDDNFATIVTAVALGRGIYANIKKSIHFLLSSNIGEVVTIFVAIMLGFPSPLLAIHLLWINLVTDSLPAIALGFEPTEKDIMEQRPLSHKEGIFAGGLGIVILLQGVMIG